ncbi:DUF2231 domain-containing protein [Dyadobacter luticola]|jgi:uncharacterized membrane protein|uniref:DUF2231 domain-containing protein n=1 Tax=Dyadobacter luticola TaxID=1979387 RepID=A0A5R9KMS3_9BACT|nr:DUF2231 domain-containing protein [Dyadobacter luticola]TLU97336.1 hypothetical protein FEN17_26485 [Dyadobacter luticola]
MKSITKVALLLTCLLLLAGASLFAHNGKKHGKAKVDSVQSATPTLQHEHGAHDSTAMQAAMSPDSDHQHGLGEFPTLHPLVVHFPIVLLIVAALLQWVGLFFYKKEITTVAWALLLLGFIGAYASSTWFHAHTAQLAPAIQAILEEHEKYASYTQWLSGIALLVQSVNIFFLKRNLWVNVSMAIVMSAAAFFVAYTGHHGAELVHKHGIGAKGYLLEQHNH